MPTSASSAGVLSEPGFLPPLASPAVRKPVPQSPGPCLGRPIRSAALSSEPAVELRELVLDDLRRAIDLYLTEAYPSGKVPDPVRARLNWPDGVAAEALLGAAPFERVSKPGTPPIYALRLGNARYPHMKLQVQAWPWPAGYILSVNTHDQILGLDPNAPDADAFRALQAENARIKDAIESRWDGAGLPIFLRYLRDYLDSHLSGV